VSIPRTSTHRPVAVAMLFLAIILLGLISYVRLPIDLLPDVSYPRLVVYTSYPDVAPSEVEDRITRQLESAAASVAGVENLSSVSREGVSLVTLRFAWGVDMDFAMLNLRERLDNLRGSLPDDASRPQILRVDPEAEPIMVLSVASQENLQTTKELAETVFRRRLEQLDGVAQAAVTGGLDREIRVEPDPDLLRAYGVTLEQIASALDAANISSPGGRVMEGRFLYSLRTLGEFQSVEEIERVVVARRTGAEDEEGRRGALQVVRVRDVARVIDGFADRENMARYNGQEAVGLLVFKESGANTVTVAESVQEILDGLALEYSEVAVDVAHSQAGFISDSISNVVQALVLGGLLAFLVLFLFLRDTRYPFAIAAAIPISVVGTFALMEAADVSLNIMSLGGLALGVGMLVDNSIVVLENIFRHREEGSEAVEAAAVGAEEVQGAITASTLTTISVFGPIIYVEGVAGELFGDLSLAVAFSLLASLLVALTLLPSMAARFATDKVELPEERPAFPERPEGFFRKIPWLFRVVGFLLGMIPRVVWSTIKQLVVFWWTEIGKILGGITRPFFDAFDRAFERFADRYHRALDWSLDHRATVLGLAAVTLAGSLALGAALPRDMLPEVDQGAFDIHIRLPEGTGLEATADAASQVETTLLGDEGVAAVFSRIGRDVRAYAEGDEEDTGLNTAVFQVRLADGYRVENVLDRIRSLEARFPSAEIAFQTGGATALGALLGGSEADVAVRVRGEDLDLMYDRAEEVQRRLAALDNLGNVRVGTERGTPQVDAEVQREVAAAYGIEPERVANAIERAMRGTIATEFVDFDRKIPITVRYPEQLRYSRAALEGLRVDDVPVLTMVELRETLGPAEVHREEQGRVIPVYADVVRGGLDQAITEIEAELSDLVPTAELRMEVGGENEEMRRSFRDLGLAFALALVLVYMILAAQFESFVHPFTILTAVPLALVGAILALVLTGEGLNTMSLIGVVILVGIVVNDAIVKVDFINQARARGMALRTSILQAGRVRLRPIVMTTVTTVLGLTPMALGIGRGADLRAPLAISVIGGLIVATVLTLIVVPVVYAVIETVRLRVRGESPAGESVPAPGTGGLAPSAAGGD